MIVRFLSFPLISNSYVTIMFLLMMVCGFCYKIVWGDVSS